jgi:transcriptional regulator with XRE-family HTH domain
MSIPSPREQVAAELRQWRNTAGYTTHELAARLGLSQSRVSRLENAKAVLRPAEATEWVQACGGTTEDAEALIARAAATRTSSSWSRSPEPGAIGRQQDTVSEREADARLIRAFHPTGIYAGLLQSAEFIRAQMMLTGTPEVEVGLARRLHRQRVLDLDGHTFEYVLTEAALKWRPGSRTTQIAQLYHLRELTGRPNVTIGLVPEDTQAPTFFTEGYTLYDERVSGDEPLVAVETTTGEWRSSDPAVLAAYQGHWEKIRAAALFGDAARELLDRVVDQLRSRLDQPERPFC